MELACNCKSDERLLGLLAKNIPDRYPELTKLGAKNTGSRRWLQLNAVVETEPNHI